MDAIRYLNVINADSFFLFLLQNLPIKPLIAIAYLMEKRKIQKK